MQEEKSEPAPYVGRVLPGSRWRQRAFKGHVEQDVTVLRVGARSVMLVIEGFIGPNGGRGATHDRRKVGQKFNVVLETFLATHTLLSQPKGYKPGDELDPTPATTGPKVDAVETYFKRRQYTADWLANMEGRAVRGLATDPDFPVLTGPQRYTGDVVVPTPTPTPTPKEEPVQSAQAEPTEPQEEFFDAVNPATREAVEVLAASITRQPSEPPAPTAVPVQAVLAPPTEVDPLDAFLDNGRAVVARLTEELSSKQQQRDEVAGLLASLDIEIAGLTRRRDKADSAVEAAIAAVLGEPDPQPTVAEVEAEMPTQAGGSEIEVRPASGGTTRLAGPMGYVPRPGKLSQRQWILDRFVRDGRLTIQEVVDEFVAEYGMPREAGIKNISSIMHHQIKNPSDQWPVPYRIYQGSYAVPTDLRQGRI